MSEAVVDDIVAVLPPLLQSLEALGFIARHLNPPDFDHVMEAAGQPDEALKAVRPRLADWPEQFADLQTSLETASDAALAAFAGLRAVQLGNGDLIAVFRALRHAPRAQEALYPLAAKLPPVSSFFVEPDLREDADLLARLAVPAKRKHRDHSRPQRTWQPRRVLTLRSGILHSRPRLAAGDGAAWRQRQWPRLPVELAARRAQPWRDPGRPHRDRETLNKSTWALMGEDADTPNLARILDSVRSRWNIDPARLLLTGMSDGGTFCYVTGLESASPFTHLAPVAATFHPLMAEMADAQRLRGLPIHLVHGRLDWMFPVQVARQTRDALTAAGADVTYRELDDLSHCYPREMNAPILKWLAGDA